MRLLDTMNAGDTIVIESLSRLGRSTKDLIELVDLFKNRGVNLVSLKESIDTTTSTGKLLFTLMSAIAEFERNTISDRTLEGLKAARARGRVGGRPRKNLEQVRQAVKLYHAGQHSLREIEELTGIKKDTLYRSLKEASA
jgi:DNA invertase Pin-like site-specific DNA recombinase